MHIFLYMYTLDKNTLQVKFWKVDLYYVLKLKLTENVWKKDNFGVVLGARKIGKGEFVTSYYLKWTVGPTVKKCL